MADLVVQLLLTGIILKWISELDIIDVTATHDVKLPVAREKDSNGAGVGLGMSGPATNCSHSELAVGVGVTPSNEIELADARVPVAVLGILVDMPEGHAIRGIDFCPRIITPARAASLRVRLPQT